MARVRTTKPIGINIEDARVGFHFCYIENGYRFPKEQSQSSFEGYISSARMRQVGASVLEWFHNANGLIVDVYETI